MGHHEFGTILIPSVDIIDVFELHSGAFGGAWDPLIILVRCIRDGFLTCKLLIVHSEAFGLLSFASGHTIYINLLS